MCLKTLDLCNSAGEILKRGHLARVSFLNCITHEIIKRGYRVVNKGGKLGRYINRENYDQERTRLMKIITLALKELLRQESHGEETRDIVAFIVLALRKITNTIDLSVQAW